MRKILCEASREIHRLNNLLFSNLVILHHSSSKCRVAKPKYLDGGRSLGDMRKCCFQYLNFALTVQKKSHYPVFVAPRFAIKHICFPIHSPKMFIFGFSWKQVATTNGVNSHLIRVSCKCYPTNSTDKSSLNCTTCIETVQNSWLQLRIIVKSHSTFR